MSRSRRNKTRKRKNLHTVESEEEEITAGRAGKEGGNSVERRLEERGNHSLRPHQHVFCHW